MSWFGWSAVSETVPDTVPSPDRERVLELFEYEACGYCMRVLRVLRQMPEVEVTLRDTMREPGAAATLRQRTGRGQVPCLFVDGEALFESEDIVRWLEAYQAWRRRTSGQIGKS